MTSTGARAPAEQAVLPGPTPLPGPSRVHFLDGVRGVAALAVVTCHCAAAFAPRIVFGSDLPVTTRYDGALHRTPILDLPFQGHFAVAVFYVLSGIALSRGPLVRAARGHRGGRAAALSGAVRRYPRLAAPVVVVMLAAWALVDAGAMHNAAAGRRSGSTWLGSFWSGPADLAAALREGFWGVFSDLHGGAPHYVPPLWTMHYELLGSVLVFAILLVLPPRPVRLATYAVLGVVLWQSFLFCFVAGMVLCELWVSGRLPQNRRWRAAFVPIGLLGLVLGSFPYASPSTPAYYAALIPGHWTDDQQQSHVLGAVLVMAAVLGLAGLQRFFGSRPLRLLGRVSFGLFLTHFLVLGSVGCATFDLLSRHLSSRSWVAVLASSVVVVVSLLVAWVATVVVDEPVVRWTGRIYRRAAGWLQERLRPQPARRRPC